MTQMKAIWSGNWEKRLRVRLKEQGFSSAVAFAKAHKKLTYKQLTQLLGDNLAPIQLIWLIRDEALEAGGERQGEVTWFAKDSLVRRIREKCGAGWGLGEKGDFKAAHATGSWISELSPMGSQVETAAHLIRDRLKERAPVGWLPEDIEDPIIQEVFSDVSFTDQVISKY